ncbi:4-hydroxy-3-methylbut-2-enyl diphosphate reductase (EC [Olavius algarvensis associated proteobacterium Delta 3]|nr:4-hydroxy-3-methylbut-2-enyl diphosphate reductase (EC [Olavius algarvensis associated proteobacterium Delta 3]
MGVRRAVEMVADASDDNSACIYTYGPLIHNPQVLKGLEEKGIEILEAVPEAGSGTVLLRAHGVPPQTKDALRKSGFQLLDATCPRVIKIQTIIKKYANQNHAIILIGDKNHAEVIGLLGYAGERGHVVSNMKELDLLPAFDNAIIVSQTTQNIEFFEAVKAWAKTRHPQYRIFETICDSTEKRQAELKKIADLVDAILIVGGHNSGNTRRLFEIARKSGKPAFHIETEKDLESIEFDAIARAPYVGISAGASTPNWIIKNVYRTLEQLPYKRNGWAHRWFSLQRLLLLTNIYVSLEAGCLTYACTKLQGMHHDTPYFLISILYVQSMHIINHLIGIKIEKYHDPGWISFYHRRRKPLAITAVCASVMSLAVAFALGTGPFLLLSMMTVLGLSYNLRLVPASIPWTPYRRVRDIPGSKTVLVSSAWGVLAAILPPLAINGTITWVNGIIFLWATGLGFVRIAFFDILDMKGDRLIDKKTFAILLGEKRMMRWLHRILVGLIALLPVLSIFQLVSGLGILLSVCPLLMLGVISAYRNHYLLPGVRLEFFVETIFILAGCIAFVWPAVS